MTSVYKVRSKNRPKKLLLCASAGGHLTQLMLLKPVWNNYDIAFVSTAEVVKKKLGKMGTTYIVGECNREHPVKTLMVALRTASIVLREKPDTVLSTGAAAGFLISLWSKMLGAEIIWVDSIANTERLSLSGRMVCGFADLILSQWPDVARRYRRVVYAGELI